MTGQYIWKKVHGLCIETGVDATPHSFRRYFATTIWDRMPDKDLHVLQQLMGHASPETTSKYLRTDRQAMCQAVDRL